MNFIRENLLKILIVLGVIIIIIIAVSSCSNKTIVSSSSKYEQKEYDMINATQKFISKRNNYIPKNIGDEKTIKLSLLTQNKEIDNLTANEDSNVSCNGYVIVKKVSKSKYKYIPHLKCGKYYETMSLSDYVIKNSKKVEDEDGLYEEGNGYIFKGENPNNYVYDNEVYYRIISINGNNEVKLISTEDFDSTSFDDRFNSQYDDTVGINNFRKSRLKETLENIYKNKEYFSPNLRSYIIPHDFCIGRRGNEDDNNISGNVECSDTIKSKIGVINTSEYLKASLDSGCNSISKYECSNYNYFLKISSSMATLNANKNDTSKVYVISGGIVEMVDAEDDYDVYPVLYLDKNALYKSGKGTYENPYILR